MRKNERAKIRIQKKHAFGRIGEVDKLTFPRGYSESEADSERRAKLLSKAVIYEVTMIDWIERMDMEANGLMYKQVITKAPKKEFELPNEEYDEVTYNMHLWQSPTLSLFNAPIDGAEESKKEEDGSEESKVAVVDDRVTLMNKQGALISIDQIKCQAFKKALQSMKRGEKSRFTISEQFLEENEDEGMEEFFAEVPAWDKAKTFVIDLELTKLIKVEDWYKDKTTIMRTLRKGKGRSPYTDSLIYFRIKIEVNDNQIFSNYPESDKVIEEQEDYKEMTLE